MRQPSRLRPRVITVSLAAGSSPGVHGGDADRFAEDPAADEPPVERARAGGRVDGSQRGGDFRSSGHHQAAATFLPEEEFHMAFDVAQGQRVVTGAGRKDLARPAERGAIAAAECEIDGTGGGVGFDLGAVGAVPKRGRHEAGIQDRTECGDNRKCHKKSNKGCAARMGPFPSKVEENLASRRVMGDPVQGPTRWTRDSEVPGFTTTTRRKMRLHARNGFTRRGRALVFAPRLARATGPVPNHFKP